MEEVVLIPRGGSRRPRYESKYLVSEGRAEAVRRFLLPWLVPDPHAVDSPDHAYPISSLYFDTSDLRLFHDTREGRENRVKLRIRSYSREESAPVFLEVKHRLNRIVQKVRCRVMPEVARAVSAGRYAGIELPEREASSFHYFMGLLERLAARPVVHIGYQRQAYVGAFHDHLRVTFDRNIVCAPAGDQDVIDPTSSWEPVELQHVVLELKFDLTMPRFLQEVVQRFGLLRVSFSKYGLAIGRSSVGQLGYSSFLSREELV